MPTQYQIKTLKGLLVEFYKFQKQHYKSHQTILEFVEESLKDPLKESCPEFHSSRLELLDIDEGFPVAHRDENGHVIAIQLRPITANEISSPKVVSYSTAAKKLVEKDLPRKLLLGCGNNPTSVCFHYPPNMDEFARCCKSFANESVDSSCGETADEWSESIIKQHNTENLEGHFHHHRGYITIDPNIVMNPTVIAEFGEWRLPFLPDNHFDLVEDEGIYLGNCKYYKEEKDRVLKKKSSL